jgi:hypothetical protein
MWEDGLKLPEVPAVSSPDSELRLQIRPRTLEAVPWEFILAGGGRRGGAVVIRSSHDAAAEQDEVAFVQAALARATGTGLVIDGRLGPATDAALREFQAHEGLAADGVLREDVLARLQARGSRPEVVLVQASASAQYGDSRGHISSGADLARQYDYAGFRVQLFEAPSVHEVRAVVEAARPAVLHIAGELRETSAGIEFRFEAGARFKRGPNDVEGFSVTTVDAILNEVPFAVERPLVVLDVDHPYSEPEVLPQLMLRNEFAAGVFSLGHCPAVLATGLAGARAYRLYEALTDGLARNRSVAGIAAEMQGQLPCDQYEPGGPATALFTNLPWLRPSRA